RTGQMSQRIDRGSSQRTTWRSKIHLVGNARPEDVEPKESEVVGGSLAAQPRHCAERITFRIRTRLEAWTLLSISGYRGPKSLWGRSLNSMAAASGHIIAEDLFPAEAAQPLTSIPRALNKIR